MSTLSQFLPASSSRLTIKYTWSRTTPGTELWFKTGGVTGDTLIAVAVGGGGSGARQTTATACAATGGGGGGVCVVGMRYEDCPLSVSVTVGAGGDARTVSGSVGLAGFPSKFGNFAIGGGGGGGFTHASANWSARVARGGWGGGGMPGAATNNATALISPLFATNDGSGGWEGRSNGGSGRSAVYDTAGGFALTTEFPIPAGLTGGGGSVSYSGGAYRLANAIGGAGRFFGGGGYAHTGATSSFDGTAPGGGGGGQVSLGESASSGAGAPGAVYVYVVSGHASASDIMLIASGTNYTVFY